MSFSCELPTSLQSLMEKRAMYSNSFIMSVCMRYFLSAQFCSLPLLHCACCACSFAAVSTCTMQDTYSVTVPLHCILVYVLGVSRHILAKIWTILFLVRVHVHVSGTYLCHVWSGESYLLYMYKYTAGMYRERCCTYTYTCIKCICTRCYGLLIFVKTYPDFY